MNKFTNTGENYIIGIFGKKGSGKTELCKRILKKVKRYIILDNLHEYANGIIITNYSDLVDYVQTNQTENYKIIFRSENRDETEKFLFLTQHINNFTLVVEEVSFYCSPYKINDSLEHNLQYGRHYNRNIIYISRRPFEVNRMLTSQSDLIISFRMNEPRDIKYLADFGFDKDIQNLEPYEFATWGDNDLLKKYLT